MWFNLASVIDWGVATAANQHQVDIDNVRENAKWVTHDYAKDDQFYAERNGIYRKLDYEKQVPYRITEVFTNVKVRFQQRQVNKLINIIKLNTYFDK